MEKNILEAELWKKVEKDEKNCKVGSFKALLKNIGVTIKEYKRHTTHVMFSKYVYPNEHPVVVMTAYEEGESFISLTGKDLKAFAQVVEMIENDQDEAL